jgi:LPS export ABC transporter protein LptC
MTRWQRRSRLFIAVFGVLFAAFVAREFKQRVRPSGLSPLVRSDQDAVVEILGGNLQQFTGSREDVSVKASKQLTYADGSSKLQGVTIVFAERNGSRTFTVTGKDGALGKDKSTMVLDGDVRLSGSDGMAVRTEHATYANGDGTVRAPGPVEFTSGRMRGSGVGMSWESARDLLVILDQAIVHIAPDDNGGGATDVASGTATFARRDKYIRFERNPIIQRSGQHIESQTAVAYLSPDGNHIETVELRESARITTPNAAAGGLQALTSHDMNLKYSVDGQALEHALLTGDAVMQLAGEVGKPGRQIASKMLDITLAPDGATPTALVGRDGVQLTFPPEAGVPGRTIKALSLDAKGEPDRGLTRALFTGNVQFRELGGDVDRAATAATLDLGLKPGMSSIEDARFVKNVRFEEGQMAATAASARYDLEKGTLALSGSEPGALVPHVVNEQIVVDAAKVDITLVGPKVSASGNVKSELRPASKGTKPGDAGNNVKLPSMLKQDQAVIVVADTLEYDGTTSTGKYTGGAQLFQTDTSIKGDSLVIDNKAGNLTASGGVVTSTVLEEVDKDKQKQRTHSIGSAKDLAYDDATRRMKYTGDAHMSGPDGDMTATRIELYLKPSGDELDRAEAYDNLTLREQNRETKGTKMIYTTADEKYVVTGAPVKIVDPCQRETIGRTLTFIKATDTIVIDGNAQIRTQTKGGGGKCPS